MKEKICYICTLLAAMFFVSTAGAQVSTYERTPGYYIFGINGGVAFQEGDIPTTLDGYGLGLTLGKNLYYQPGALFSFDVRGRALYSQTKGQDYNRSYGILDNDALNGNLNLNYTKEAGGPGFVFQNNKTDHAELGIEGVINFNKLREKTNVNLSLFGGIGLDWYRVTTDQANSAGLYSDAYLGIDTLSSVSFIKKQLNTSILDGRYETEVNGAGKLKIMPALGVELGYQFTPKFSMGLGHKVTFTKTDLFDGHQWENNNTFTPEDDIHHYTNLHMRWIINDNSKKLQAPIVDITNPSLSPHTTRSSTFDVRATVKNISSAMDIQFTVNGYRETFNFKKKDFKSFINLRPGNNEVVITATNNAGSDSDVVNIFYQEPIIDTRPDYPTVDITNPPYEDYRTDQNRFDVKADLRNVSNKRDIEVIVNGRETRDFDFRNGRLNARVDLREGRNTIRIGANNQDGFASDETTIILEDNISNRPPSVDITKPSVDPYATSNSNVTIEAKVYNIEDKQDIRYTIDGYESYDFTFSNNVFYATVNVDKPKTVVVITATNEAGQDEDSVVILWEEEVEPIERPVVTITSTSQPTVDPFDPDNCRSTVIATILNIEDRNDIDVYVNGQHFVDYDFNSNTQVFRATVRLVQGTNQIRIRATNAAGSDEAITTTQGCNTQESEEKPPVVTITQPSNNQKFTKPEAVVKATVLNVSNKNDITFEVNGNRYFGFTYDKFSNTVSANITLTQGNNTVFIEARNNDGSDNDQVNITYQEIQITRPPNVSIQQPRNSSTTSTQRVELIAKAINVAAKNDIDVFLNGRNISNFSFNTTSKEIKADLKLDRGRNIIRVVGSNDAGSDEASVSIRYAPSVPKAPTVDIKKPLNNAKVSTTKVSLVAAITNVKEKREISVRVNGRTISNFNIVKNEVVATLNIRAGTNSILVTATTDGGIAEDRVTVFYEAPKPKTPEVNITKPKNNSVTEKATTKVQATIKYITNRSEIIFTINGKRSNAFNYQAGTFIAEAKLVQGKNTITVKARNADGEDEDRVVLTYKQAQIEIPPTVSITSPKNNETFEQAKVQLTANITNVDSKRKVTMKVNGKSQNFEYSKGKLTATITLKKGRSTVRISASNNAGRDEASISVIYTPVVNTPKPVVQFTNPANPGGTTKTGKFTIKAVAKNVTSKRNIRLLLNGRAVSKVSFNTKTKVVTATVNLKDGLNTFSIEGTNEAGKDMKQSSVTLKRVAAVEKNPPKVTIVSVSNPTVDPFDPNKAKSTVIAKLDNINSKRAITFTFNGKKINNFSFNKRTGDLQVTLTLKKGNNTFEIKATNKDGSDSANRSIQFGNGVGTGGTSSRNSHLENGNNGNKGPVSRRGGGE